MSGGAILTMIVFVSILWGGFGLALVFAIRAERDKPSSET